MNRIMKTSKHYIALLVISVSYVALNSPIYGQNHDESQEIEVTCMAENPKDGSMWMGTANNGLYRLSKTGSRLHYGASKGKLGSNSILYICFDSEAKLWVLGKGGSLTSYTAKDGFRNRELEDTEISTAIYLPKKEKLMLASVTKIYSFSTRSEKIESEGEMPFQAVNLKLSTDSTYVWIFGEKKVARLAEDGTVIEWSGVGDVSEMIPLEFETYTDENTPRSYIWIIIIICAVVFGGALALGLVFGKKRLNKHPKEEYGASQTSDSSLYFGLEETKNEEAPSEPEIEPEQPVVKPAKKTQPVTKSESKSTEFTTRILMLIEQHYKDPNFDVDAIAELTGVSRIHVNRKLKAEGAPSPSTLLRDKRMEVAKFFLLQSEMPMAQIASECGFRSPSYFTTAFKDYTGLTPSEFVAQNKL